jgi:hypothetical protein
MKKLVDRLFEDRDGIDLSLTATCLLLAVDRYTRPIPILLALLALFFRSLQRSAGFWLILAAAIAVGTLDGWPHLDNHKYLINYWALAIGCCLFAADPERAIAANARLLIGLAFLLAVAQKLATPDFLDGTYFHFQLVKDPYFAPLAQWAGGASSALLEANVRGIGALHDYSTSPSSLVLSGGPRIPALAQAMTWWTLLIEIAVAVGFLLRRPAWPARWRDPILLVFLFTTYLFAHVAAFGWILVAMGLAQTEPRSRLVRSLYVVAFLAVLAYALPHVAYNWEAQAD